MHVPHTDGEHYYCTLFFNYYIKITDPFQTIRKHYFRKHHKKFVQKPSSFSVNIKNVLKNELKIIHANEYNARRKMILFSTILQVF